MACSKSELQLLGDKIKDPYHAIIWSGEIYHILEDEDQFKDLIPNAKIPSAEHDANCRLYAIYLDVLRAKYVEALQFIFQIKDKSNDRLIINNAELLEKEFDNGWSVGECEVAPELVNILNDSWDEVENKHKSGELVVHNWNDVAFILAQDRSVEYLKAKYDITIINQEILDVYMSKNRNYIIP